MRNEQNSDKHNSIELDTASAKRMLENIFKACDVTPNAIPFEQLETRHDYVSVNFRVYKFISLIIIFLLLLIPIFFIPTNVEMSSSGDNTATNSFSFKVSSLIPVKKFQAKLNGLFLPVTNNDNKEYVINVEDNGELHVSITLVNGRSANYKYSISSVKKDEDNPVITDKSLNNNELTLFVNDELSGVNFSGAYAVNLDGTNVAPLSFNEAAGTIVFPYKHETLNIFIPDKNGNVLQAIVSTSQRLVE